jgi:hypothetical protein
MDHDGKVMPYGVFELRSMAPEALGPGMARGAMGTSPSLVIGMQSQL